MTAETKSEEEVADDWLQRLWSDGDLVCAGELLAPDYRRNDARHPIEGPAQYAAFVG